MTTPKYRTDSLACSCPGYWYRRTCKHYRAYREAVALVVAQDAVNRHWQDCRYESERIKDVDTGSPTGANLVPVGVSPAEHGEADIARSEAGLSE